MQIGEVVAYPHFFIEKLPNDQTEQFSLTRGPYDGVASLGEIFWYPGLDRYVFRTSGNNFVWNTELHLLGKFIDNLEDPRKSKETKMIDVYIKPDKLRELEEETEKYISEKSDYFCYSDIEMRLLLKILLEIAKSLDIIACNTDV